MGGPVGKTVHRGRRTALSRDSRLKCLLFRAATDGKNVNDKFTMIRKSCEFTLVPWRSVTSTTTTRIAAAARPTGRRSARPLPLREAAALVLDIARHHRGLA